MQRIREWCRLVTGRQAAAGAALALILSLAAVLRCFTFYLPHNHGDQLFYLGLAMKLDTAGLAQYNLRNLDVVQNHHYIGVVPAAAEKGTLLQQLEQGGVFYYSREPLSNMPPAFSYLLMWMHRLVCPTAPYVAVNHNLGKYVLAVRPPEYAQAQGYAAAVNFALSLFLVLLTYALGRHFFDAPVALGGAFLFAVSPVDLLTAQRLWADELTACALAGAVLVYFRVRRPFAAAAAGALVGLGALAKASGLFAFFFIPAADFLQRAAGGAQSCGNRAWWRQLLVFWAVGGAVASFWYARVTAVYGAPWYSPQVSAQELSSAWFAMLAARPRWGQLVYFVQLLPLLGFFYVEAAYAALRRQWRAGTIVCAVWFAAVAALVLAVNGKEERYLLPAYPAIALLSAAGLQRMRRWLRRRGGSWGITLFWLTVGAVSWMAVEQGLQCVFDNRAIFPL
ncbi:MAG: hypothetical protein NC924_04545 [Candidatus Omnitrophica bacterium]|nr:hypothetical protein [Candidatus Omnitrophota bacterium]